MSLSVGDTGIFTTSEISIPNVNYTITAINTISNLVNLSIDVFAVAYEIYGLTQTDYDSHDSHTQIFTLQDELGVSINVPEPYLAVVSENGYISYSDKAMVVNLGSWPEREFNAIEASVTNLVTERLGVVPTIRIQRITRPKLLLLADHEYIEFRREAKQVQYIDPNVLLATANQKLHDANIKIDKYRIFIDKYLKHCKKRCDEVIEPPFRAASCMSILERTFNIHCPCFPRNYPERILPRKPLPKREVTNCGGIVGTTFRICGTCISPTAVYGCKSKIRFQPKARPITRNVIPCQSMSSVPFSVSMRICPAAYHSKYSKCR